jgi:HK97 gp10 family phage protein
MQRQIIAFKIEKVYQAVGAVVGQVLSQTVDMTENMAVHRAPVRRVFAGGRSTKRTLTMSELQAETPSLLRAMTATARKSAVREMRATGAGVPTFRIGTEVITHPNRANTWRASSIDRRVQSVPGTTFRLAHAYGDLIAVPKGVGNFELINPAAVFGLNKEGRRSLRKAKIAVRDNALRDIGRGALSIEPVFNTEHRMGIPRKEFAGVDVRLGGNLRASIHQVGPNFDGARVRFRIVAGGQRAPYAKFMEFGTRYVAAKPFLRPALKHAETRLPQRMRSALKQRFG